MQRYALIGKVVQVGQLYSRFVQKDAFEHGVVLGLLFFKTVVDVDSSHLGVSVYLGAGSLFGVLVGRGLVSLVIVGLVEVTETGGLVLVLEVLLSVELVVYEAHLELALTWLIRI